MPNSEDLSHAYTFPLSHKHKHEHKCASVFMVSVQFTGTVTFYQIGSASTRHFEAENSRRQHVRPKRPYFHGATTISTFGESVKVEVKRILDFGKKNSHGCVLFKVFLISSEAKLVMETSRMCSHS
ncbi:unnamed protein product [Protopolystoma xenopodis]|uniref:Uncharacterized protein n=1 Tax=Protopolystoma xenopodis TaxID=117903 RepID=A0A3S5CLR2_9PLAT|nr:unnamed protein product [Protopolystoma xenopodis]